MANYGKYYIAVRLLLLKQYLEANAGRTRIVKRMELLVRFVGILIPFGMRIKVRLGQALVRGAHPHRI